MSLYNIVSYNLDVAKVLGPLSAIYISFIDKSNEDNKNDKLSLSRTDILNKTGIDERFQEEVEKFLFSKGILDIQNLRNSSEKNYYSINYERLDSIINDPEKLNEIYKLTTKSPFKKKVDKETKKEQTLKRLKNAVKVDDEVLKQYIFDWIDSIIEKGGYITTQSIKINVNELMKFATSQEIAIKVLTIATKNCWRDLSWAMNRVNSGLNDRNNFNNYNSIVSNESFRSEEAF